jgi:hypothetical protein
MPRELERRREIEDAARIARDGNPPYRSDRVLSALTDADRAPLVADGASRGHLRSDVVLQVGRQTPFFAL